MLLSPANSEDFDLAKLLRSSSETSSLTARSLALNLGFVESVSSKLLTEFTDD